MDLASFKDMLGILGNFYLSERMFAAIDRDKDGYISQEEYINYIDVLTYGTSSEKNQFTFRIIDISGEGDISYDEFK